MVLHRAPSSYPQSPIFLPPKPLDAPGYTPCARSSTPSSTSCVAAVPGAYCHTTSLDGPPSPLLSLLALGWHLGKDARRPTQTSAGAPEEEPAAQRGDSG